MFHQITFDEGTVPAYTPYRDDLIQFFRDRHPGKNVTHPNRNWHGFGYRNMCRFFGGLLPYAPLIREFDYYVRVDGGDSRIDDVKEDIFVRMQTKQAVYGYYNIIGYDQSSYSGWRGAHKNYLDSHPGSGFDPGFPEVGDNSRYTGHQYYNNFEVMDMRQFRNFKLFEYFMFLDREAVFYCPNRVITDKHCADGNNGIGDAEVRTIQIAMFFKQNQVIGLGDIVRYRHPVPDWCDSE